MAAVKSERVRQGLRVEATDVAGFIPLVGTPILLTKLSDARGRLADVSEGFKAVTLRQVAEKYSRGTEGKLATAQGFGHARMRLTGMERAPTPAPIYALHSERSKPLRGGSAKSRPTGRIITGAFGNRYHTRLGTEEHRLALERSRRLPG